MASWCPVLVVLVLLLNCIIAQDTVVRIGVITDLPTTQETGKIVGEVNAETVSAFKMAVSHVNSNFWYQNRQTTNSATIPQFSFKFGMYDSPSGITSSGTVADKVFPMNGYFGMYSFKTEGDLYAFDSDCSHEGGIAAAKALIGSTTPPKIIIGAKCSDACKSSSKEFNGRVVQISPSCTSPQLSDQTTYKNFFRTTGSDVAQAKALAEIWEQFEWSKTAFIYTNDSYAKHLTNNIRTELEGRGIEIGYSEEVEPKADEAVLVELADRVRESNIGVVFLIMHFHNAEEFLRVAKDKNIGNGNEITYFVADGITAELPGTPKKAELFRGMIGTRPPVGVDWAPMYESLRTEWTTKAGFARSDKLQGSLTRDDTSAAQGHTGAWVVETYDAVLAAAIAIENCIGDSACDVTAVDQIAGKLKLVDFEGTSGELTFGPKSGSASVLEVGEGDRQPIYDIVNFVGSKWHRIGKWDFHADERLTIHEAKDIHWPTPTIPVDTLMPKIKIGLLTDLPSFDIVGDHKAYTGRDMVETVSAFRIAVEHVNSNWWQGESRSAAHGGTIPKFDFKFAMYDNGIGTTSQTVEKTCYTMTHNGEPGGVGYFGHPQFCHPKDLIVADSGCLAENATEAAKQLKDIGVAVVIGPECSDACKASSAVLDKSALQISYSCTSPDLSDNGAEFTTYPFFFRTCAPDTGQAKALTDLSWSKWQWKKVAVVATNDSYSAKLSAAFQQEMAQLGGSIIYGKALGQGTAVTKQQFASAIDDIMLTDAGVIFLSMHEHNAEKFVEQAIQKGIKKGTFAYLVPDGVTGSIPTDAAILNAFRGFVGTRPRSGDGDLYTAFKGEWASRSPVDYQGEIHKKGEAVGVWQTETYDAVIAAAIGIQSCMNQREGTPCVKMAAIRNKVAKVNFQGVSGLVQFGPTDPTNNPLNLGAGDRGPAYDVVNFITKWNQVGHWIWAETPKFKFFDHIVWPNDVTNTPPSDTRTQVSQGSSPRPREYEVDHSKPSLKMGILTDIPSWKKMSDESYRWTGQDNAEYIAAFRLAVHHVNSNWFTRGNRAAEHNSTIPPFTFNIQMYDDGVRPHNSGNITCVPMTGTSGEEDAHYGTEEFCYPSDLLVADSGCEAENGTKATNELIQRSPKVIIGPCCSTACMASAQILGPQQVVQISPSCTSTALSDSEKFPYFFRTAAPDSGQSLALADLVAYYKWKKVATVATVDAYSKLLADQFEVAVKKNGGRILTSQRLGTDTSVTRDDLAEAVKRVKLAGAGIILLTMHDDNTFTFLEEALKADIIDRNHVFIGVDANTIVPQEVYLQQAMSGMLGTQPRGGIGDLYKSLLGDWVGLPPTEYPSRLHNQDTYSTGVWVTEVYDAVLAAAVAVQNILNKDATIQDPNAISADLLKEELKSVRFVGSTGVVSFGAPEGKELSGINMSYGDRLPVYNIVNMQGTFKTVGTWSAETQKVQLTGNVMFPGGRLLPPLDTPPLLEKEPANTDNLSASDAPSSLPSGNDEDEDSYKKRWVAISVVIVILAIIVCCMLGCICWLVIKERSGNPFFRKYEPTTEETPGEA